MCQLRTVICLASLLLLSAAASAQQDYINTFAGGGPNNVPATSASVGSPTAVAVDSSGNYYFATNGSAENRVFKVNTSGTLTVFAGNGPAGDSGDGGPAPQAELWSPTGVAADSFGNVYIADSVNCTIRKVTGGIISTFAGTPGNCSYGGDGGAATNAFLYYPYGVAVDSSGNVYIADWYNFRIREVTVSNGQIDTVAGNGSFCSGGGTGCGDGGAATSAGLSFVYSLAVDGSGNIYLADFYAFAIRKFTVGGSISTVAGNGTYCTAGGAACGDGGLATSAGLSGVYGIAVDSAGNIFIADQGNFAIREVTVSTVSIYTATGKISSAPGYIYTVAGNGTPCPSSPGAFGDGAACGDGGLATSAGLSAVVGVGVDSSDDIFIADYWNLRIREVTVSNGYINTVAGNGTFFFGNGIPATNSVLESPVGATSDSAGNIYIADAGNCVVREVNATTGIITTLAGTPGNCSYGGDSGPATSAQLSYPSKAVVYAGNVYIADSGNCVIREVDWAGDISTFAGTPGVCTPPSGYTIGDGGPATSAYLNYPSGVALDSSGNVYIADSGNQVIREVSGGIINTVAGNETPCSSSTAACGDGGAATVAELNYPGDVAVDAFGNLYIADTMDLRIRMVNTGGIISTFAGNGLAGFTGDGIPANASSLSYPSGVAVDAAGDVLIADTGNNRIRWVDGQGIIHTAAGDANGDYGFFGDGGPATSAWLASPDGVGVDPSGNIYIADSANNLVRMVNAVAGLNASTTNVTFGSQGVGTTSSSQTVTLAAIGPLDISNIAVTGDFRESGDCETGPMPGRCVMRIVFKPTALGVRSGTVTINDNGYFSTSLLINLQGTGIGASLSPSALVFAPQVVGTTSAAKTLTLTNYLSSALTISSATLGGANRGDFAVQGSSTCPYPSGSLKANSSCTYKITFKPSLNGAESATFAVADADGTQRATLSGTGLEAALTPSALVFAAQDGGTTSAAKTLTLTNYLSSALTISSATLGGANSGDFAVQGSSTCPYPTGSLKANSSCTYKITFKPSLNGAESATLSISDADGTQTATLSGTGIGAALAPTALGFAARDGGTTSAAKTLTLTNYLSSSLSLAPSFSGANPTDFAISPTSTCGSSLAPTSSCTYNITFKPSVNGVESATLSVSDSDGTQRAMLWGAGIGASLAPTALVFPAQTRGTTSPPKTLTLTNYLSSSLSLSAIIGGANHNDFAVQGSSTCPFPTGSLAASSSCTYNITFKPSVHGTESATLTVSDADGTQTATLQGTGK